MKILIIDRDRLSTQLIKSKLESDHHITIEPVKKDAMALLEKEHFDIVIIDPAPLPSAKALAMQLRWRKTEHYTYLLLLTNETTMEEVVRSGMNDFLLKPCNPRDLKKKLENAQWLINFTNNLRIDPDIRTHKDTFGKHPFLQLILSALDRAFRYSEKAFLIFIQLSNYNDISSKHTPHDADKTVGMIRDYLSDLRRMSDFIARTNTNEFVILMQRPWDETEPLDAADRFVLAMQEFETKYSLSKIKPKFKVKLVELPSSNLLLEKNI